AGGGSGRRPCGADARLPRGDRATYLGGPGLERGRPRDGPEPGRRPRVMGAGPQEVAPPDRGTAMNASALAQSATGSESRLVRVLDGYLASLQRGDAPDKSALLAAHPDLADDLETCLASLDFIRRAAAPEPDRLAGGQPLDGQPATGLL